MAPSSRNSGSSLYCTQCGGELEPVTGQRLLVCAFCGSSLFIDRSGVVRHYRVRALLQESEALAALRRWMAGNDTVKGLDREAELRAPKLVSFPVWLFRFDAPGGERVIAEPAAPTPIPQLADLRVPAGRLEPYRGDLEDATMIEASVPLETARGWLEQRGVTAVDETALVQVPLWSCGYRYRNRDFVAMVDGSTGAVLAADYPEKSESPYLLTAALGVILFGLEGLLIGSPLLKLIAYVVTAIPLTLMAYWVTSRV